MNLKTRILLLSISPIILLCVITFFLSSNLMSSSINTAAYEGMEATCIAVKQIIEHKNGDYHLDSNGHLWRGDQINISDSNELVDSIKKNTNYDVTVFFGDTRYLTTIVNDSGERQVGTKASDVVIENVLNKGQDYYGNNVDVLGQRYICYYMPIYQASSNEVAGIIFLGQKYSVIQNIILTAQLKLLLYELIVLILTAIAAYLISCRLVKAMQSSIKYVEQISEGNLTLNIDASIMARKDEIGSMCMAIQKFNAHLTSIVTQIQNQCSVLAASSEEYSKTATFVLDTMEQMDITVQNIATSTTIQAQETSDAGNNAVQMGETISDTFDKVKELTNTTHQMTTASKEATEILSELNESMLGVINSVDMISQETNQTNDSVNQASEMTAVITEIAAQTTLLSLNASIEAARAGEQGRGFAVVASEIQQLAEQCNKSAVDIQKILQILKENSETSVHTMNNVRQMIELQEEKLSHTNHIFEVVAQGIVKSAEGIDVIQNKTHLLNNAKSKTIDIVQNVAAIAQENAATTQQSAASVGEVTQKIDSLQKESIKLQEIANTLVNEIKIFKV